MDRAQQQASGGIGTGDPDVGDQTAVAGGPYQSAADVRREIVILLGPDREMTPDEVEKAITRQLPAAQHGVVTSQIQVLQDGRYVRPAQRDTRRLTLTDSGKRWLSGIRALSG